MKAKMKKNAIALTIISFLLAGCQQLQDSYDKISTDFKKSSVFKKNDSLDGKEVIKTSLKAICNDFAKNKYKAEEKWDGTVIQFTDVIIDVSKSRPMFDGDPYYQGDRAVFEFTSGLISSTSHRECRAGAFVDLADLKKYSVGERVTIKGFVSIGNLSSNLISLQPSEIKE